MKDKAMDSTISSAEKEVDTELDVVAYVAPSMLDSETGDACCEVWSKVETAVACSLLV